ncbi:hypothetical protein CHELA41_50931 [Hyphomicrobiales bacterium]|nr:hypothetical protein CHELA41_50931 [Hyphomicrobiales bacterium]
MRLICEIISLMMWKTSGLSSQSLRAI